MSTSSRTLDEHSIVLSPADEARILKAFGPNPAFLPAQPVSFNDTRLTIRLGISDQGSSHITAAKRIRTSQKYVRKWGSAFKQFQWGNSTPTEIEIEKNGILVTVDTDALAPVRGDGQKRGPRKGNRREKFFKSAMFEVAPSFKSDLDDALDEALEKCRESAGKPIGVALVEYPKQINCIMPDGDKVVVTDPQRIKRMWDSRRG